MGIVRVDWPTGTVVMTFAFSISDWSVSVTSHALCGDSLASACSKFGFGDSATYVPS